MNREQTEGEEYFFLGPMCQYASPESVSDTPVCAPQISRRSSSVSLTAFPT